jgi:hypothetical protein
MKKLSLFAGVVIITIACSFSTFKKPNDRVNLKQRTYPKSIVKSSHAKPPAYDETLNGVDEKTARGMIDFFKNKIYNQAKFTKLNFWFGINVVNDIVTLLHDEKADGIRIYFVCDTQNTANMSILLVPTTRVGNVPSEVHQDYYLHSSSEQLFTDKGIAGLQYKEGESSGAKLYTRSGEADDPSCDFPHHPHYLKRADAENMVIGFGKNNINTRAEWFPTSVFEDIISNKRTDGMRIYFATHADTVSEDTTYRKRDAFVIATTEKDISDSTNHNDYFDCVAFLNLNIPRHRLIPGQDNGSLCPNNCNP